MSPTPENQGRVHEDVKSTLGNGGPVVQSEPARGSGRLVDDFSSFCEGDLEPTLNKEIRTLILSDINFIVYLDNDFSVEWSTVHHLDPEGFAEIENRIAHLEALSKGRLHPAQVESFSRLLGEAMGRILGEHDLEKAHEVLEYAEAYLNARSVENARVWYVQRACALTVPAAVAAVLLWLARSPVRATVGDNAFDLLLGSALGAVGALFSMLIRVRKLDVDAVAGPHIHKLESSARIAAGSIGALIVGLAIKAKLLFSFATGREVLLAVCLVAGASERIVPGFIKQVEDTVSRTRVDKKSAKKKPTA